MCCDATSWTFDTISTYTFFISHSDTVWPVCSIWDFPHFSCKKVHWLRPQPLSRAHPATFCQSVCVCVWHRRRIIYSSSPSLSNTVVRIELQQLICDWFSSIWVALAQLQQRVLLESHKVHVFDLHSELSNLCSSCFTNNERDQVVLFSFIIRLASDESSCQNWA